MGQVLGGYHSGDVFSQFYSNPLEGQDGRLANELRQLLVCPRLHTVSIRIECSPLDKGKELYDILRAIAEICAQLRGKIGGRLKVEIRW